MKELPDDCVLDPGFRMLRAERRSVIDFYIDLMGDQEAAILRAAIFDEHCTANISIMLDRSEHHVRAILLRARKKLIKTLQEERESDTW